ncbi:MAG TPA: hypothetical protein VLS90_13150 [Thermodesulfobacteriota bacterium]|nr:hypothetical protein [Thermodesulfobacteriota bacterium]
MKKILLLVLIGCCCLGCTGDPLKLASLQNKTSDNYQVLGEGQGEANSFMLFNLFPIGHHDRLDRAYDEAVKAKGGDGLLDPVVQENWFWTPVGNGFATKITGTVIKTK